MYAIGRGYTVHSVHANLDGGAGQETSRQVCSALLDLVHGGPAPAHPETDAGASGDNLVVVVYDVHELLNKEGGPDAIAKMIAACGVRVESALPPHTAEEINGYFPAEALPLASGLIRSLLRKETFPGAGLPPAPVWGGTRLDAAAAEGPEFGLPEPISDAAWDGLLNLLGDEDRLGALVAAQRADAGARAFWLDARDAARQAEAEAERRSNVLLDLLLEGSFDRELLRLRLRLAETQIRTLRQKRRTAEAHVAACELPPAAEDLLVAVGHSLLPALDAADGATRARIAAYMQFHAVAGCDGAVQVSCLLPLVDESLEPMRLVGGLVALPAGAYPLRWRAADAVQVAEEPAVPAGDAA
jgi:hypothetical protein